MLKDGWAFIAILILGTEAQLAHWRSVHPSAFVPLKASGAFTNKVLQEETTPATKKRTNDSDDETAEFKLSIGQFFF